MVLVRFDRFMQVFFKVGVFLLLGVSDGVAGNGICTVLLFFSQFDQLFGLIGFQTGDLFLFPQIFNSHNFDLIWCLYPACIFLFGLTFLSICESGRIVFIFHVWSDIDMLYWGLISLLLCRFLGGWFRIRIWFRFYMTQIDLLHPNRWIFIALFDSTLLFSLRGFVF
jgi:hypothetical protein